VIDAERVQRAFEGHHARGQELARWELLLPLYLSTVAESNTLTFTFAADLGAMDRLFPTAFGPPYTVDGKRAHCAEGRRIFIKGSEVRIEMHTKDSKPAPWDSGVQDAVLRTIVTELLPSVTGAQTSRWTDSPFEEHDPAPLGPDAARKLLLRITAERVFVEFDVDYFAPGEAANPDLEIHVHDADGRCTEARVSTVAVRSGGSWVPAGTQKVTAVARVFSQGLSRWTRERKRAHEVLWQSPTLIVELQPMRTYRFAVGVARALRVLTEEERRFLQEPEARLDSPRELLDLRLVKESVKEPWGA
jgi:hypothetical protein